MNHASLFSGIGGFDLAAEWMGWTNIFNCEWEEFPRRVLKHHFPNAEQYGDIRELRATDYAGRIDILTGGFPCQPYSVAGKRLGKEDERHLWPEMLRIIRECAPRYVVGENVRGLVGWNDGLVFEEVCSDLETEGYAVQPFILPAAGVGSCPHRRDRVWFVAHCENNRLQQATNAKQKRGESKSHDRQKVRFTPNTNGGGGYVADTQMSRGPRQRFAQQGQIQLDRRNSPDLEATWQDFPTVPPVCGRNDGLPKELDGITFPKWRQESIKAYGNAIVPQVALQIFKAIEAYEREILV